LIVNKYLVWGKLVVYRTEGAFHIPGREQEVVTQILLILSSISVAQGGDTLQPFWHNTIPDGSQPFLSMPQRHPDFNEVQSPHLGGNATSGFTSPLFLPPHTKYIQFEKHCGEKATVKRNKKCQYFSLRGNNRKLG